MMKSIELIRQCEMICKINVRQICEVEARPKECFANEHNRLSLLCSFGSLNLGAGRMAGTGYGVLDAVSVFVG